MRIAAFWAQGFRSLRDVRMEGLGAFNVLYGPNGSGKSNLLEGIRLLLEILRVATPYVIPPNLSATAAMSAVLKNDLVRRRDLYARDDARTIVLGARFVTSEPGKPILTSGPVENLFDLDPTGYFDVRLDPDNATVINHRPIADIDHHFYEPGPTLHALEELLASAPADKVMFRRDDGSPVTAHEMVRMLRAANPVALDYLRNLHAAAVDVVGLRARRAHGERAS